MITFTLFNNFNFQIKDFIKTNLTIKVILFLIFHLILIILKYLIRLSHFKLFLITITLINFFNLTHYSIDFIKSSSLILFFKFPLHRIKF